MCYQDKEHFTQTRGTYTILNKSVGLHTPLWYLYPWQQIPFHEYALVYLAYVEYLTLSISQLRAKPLYSQLPYGLCGSVVCFFCFSILSNIFFESSGGCLIDFSLKINVSLNSTFVFILYKVNVQIPQGGKSIINLAIW